MAKEPILTLSPELSELVRQKLGINTVQLYYRLRHPNDLLMKAYYEAKDELEIVRIRKLYE